MKQLLIDMKEILEDVEVDIDKFVNGTNAAAGRARKKMQQIKKMAQEMRVMVQEEKNARVSGKKTVKKKSKGKKK